MLETNRFIMNFKETNLRDCFVIEFSFGNYRGYFFENFNKQDFEQETTLKVNIVQKNEAFSNRGFLRDLYFQKGGNNIVKKIKNYQA